MDSHVWRFDWDAFLRKHRDAIIDQWHRRLKRDISEHYNRRETEELKMTTAKACDAFSCVLSRNDYSRINAFINDITEIRLDAGFPLADVQKAFELFRQIVTPILIEESPPHALVRNIESVNTGLAYTIHRFSNHFQGMHETYLKEYAKRLEKDVAERTAALKDSEEQYRSLVEEISDGYLALHRESIAFVNTAYCRMHDVEPDEVLKRSFLDFVAPQHAEDVRRRISRPKTRAAEPEAFEYLRRKKDGTCLPTEINFRLSRFKGYDYNLCIVRDITKRVEMEKRSRDLERMAYIGKLTASLSHEIRNPLSSIKMNLQILSKNEKYQGNDKKRLDISEREIRRLEGILEELLDFAKPVALQPDAVDINAVVHAGLELLDVKINRQGIVCDMRLAPDLPLVQADRGKIEQVIINLLLNALEALETSGRIRIETRRRDIGDTAWVVIRVKDDGKGVARHRKNRIFEPFYTTKTTGTGLGLANVKRIVAAHGGKVTLLSGYKAGTVFEVLLPVNP